MSKALSIQIKSAFLIIIFAMNMFVGFACSVEVDMGFNAKHQHEEEGTEINDHNADSNPTHHDEAEEHQHHKKDGSEKDNCCHDKVVKLTQTDKAVPQLSSIINPVFFATLISSYYNINTIYPLQLTISNKYFVLGHHPPISNIRIAIQSFQI